MSGTIRRSWRRPETEFDSEREDTLILHHERSVTERIGAIVNLNPPRLRSLPFARPTGRNGVRFRARERGGRYRRVVPHARPNSRGWGGDREVSSWDRGLRDR